MRLKPILGLLILFIALSIMPFGCDFTSPQRTFRLAVPKTEYFYNFMAGHLKPFLEGQGYNITMVPAENTTDANRLVAVGEADLALVNNHSSTVARKLDQDAGQLRTVLPLTTRLLFAFTKEPLPDSTRAIHIFENRRVGIEQLDGETHLTLERFMNAAKIKGTTFVPFEDNPETIVFWGSLYGERAEYWMDKGWHPYSFNSNWVEFVMLNDHALRPFTLPYVPGDKRTIRVKTLATDVILVANKSVGENACYLLAQVFFQNKVDLMRQDIMYGSIREDFNKETLLFPLHHGTFSFLLRDQPSFFERYAESLALGLSVMAVLYGIIQALQNRRKKNQKENIDKYFLEFLEIRSDKSLKLEARFGKLDELFQRAVIQLTNEKLDKSDFHILSRLIQQDLTMMRFNT